MLSVWERNSFIHYHHIVIGSGIVGLTTAWYLKQRFPAQQVLVLERGLLPSGASTKNAGFACMGSMTELLDNLQTASEQEVVALFMLRKRGLERLQTLLGHQQMGYQAGGSYELLFEKDLDTIAQIHYLNQLLKGMTKQDAFVVANEKISTFGLNKQKVKALIENTGEGEIDTGLMMKNLINKVLSAGIEIKTGAMVSRFHENQQQVDLVCHDPVSHEEIIFSADKLFICNNAFAKSLLPGEDIFPGRGQVLITQPIPDLKCKGIFHFDRGYYYFRAYKQCILLGGGRNLDFETESSSDFTLNEKIQQDLEQKLREIILPEQDFTIDLRWTGIMAFGATKRPIVKQVSPRVFAGVRMGGMGVAIGSEIGFQLSEWG